MPNNLKFIAESILFAAILYGFAFAIGLS